MPDSMKPPVAPEDVEAGKAAFDAAGVDADAASKMAEALMPGAEEGAAEPAAEDADPWDSHMGKSLGEDWGKTPDSVKSHIKGLHDLLADSDLPDATEDMLEKEVKDVTDAAADGDKEKMMVELADLKSKLAEMETANGSLKSENDKYQKHLIGQLIKHLRESVAAEAPDLADDADVMADIDAYYDVLKDDADLFEHAPNAVMLAVGKARKNGKKAPEPKKDKEPAIDAAVIVAESPAKDKEPAKESSPEIPGMGKKAPMMSEFSSGGAMEMDKSGKKKKTPFDAFMARKH